MYSNYLGGDDNDLGNGIAADGHGNTYVAGYTTSTNFPTHNAWQSSLAGCDDAFVARFCSCDSEPVLVVNKTLFNFAKNNWGDTTDSQGFLIRNIGEGTLNWTVSDDADWPTCSPVSGTNFREVTVTVDASGLEPCTYTGTISVSDPNAINSPQTISVTLRIYGPKGSHPLTAWPFGFFETPGEGARVRGSVPFTGWHWMISRWSVLNYVWEIVKTLNISERQHLSKACVRMWPRYTRSTRIVTGRGGAIYVDQCLR